MKDYNAWFTPTINSEEVIFDLSEKQYIKVNDSILEYKCIINDANEWQKDIDSILLIKKETLNSIKIGDIITFEDKTHLVVFEPEDRAFFWSAKIRLSKASLLHFQNNIIYQIPYIVSSAILGTKETKYQYLPDGTMKIKISNNVINQTIQRNEIFKIGAKNNYECTDINDVLEPGLLILELKWTAEQQVLPIYSLTILNGANLTISTTQPLTLNVEVKANDIIIISPPPLIFSSSNVNVATVNNLGVVTIKSTGNVVFTCKIEGNLTVLDTIGVVVNDVVLNNYTYEIIGDSEIKPNITKIYVVKKYLNGTEVSGTFNMSIVAGITPSTKYLFNGINNNSCSLKSLGYLYYVDIVAVDNSNGNITQKQIKLRSSM